MSLTDTKKFDSDDANIIETLAKKIGDFCKSKGEGSIACVKCPCQVQCRYVFGDFSASYNNSSKMLRNIYNMMLIIEKETTDSQV